MRATIAKKISRLASFHKLPRSPYSHYRRMKKLYNRYGWNAVYGYIQAIEIRRAKYV